MLSHCDAALIIGDNALLQDAGEVRRQPDTTTVYVEKIDLGEVWTRRPACRSSMRSGPDGSAV